ncbi:MAG: choice-of-anchor B family protein [Ignavibacteria bacterium]
MKYSIIFLSIIFFFNLQESTAQLADKNMYVIKNLNTHPTPYSAIWGYRAPDGREYAILGCYDGTSFVDVTDAYNIHQAGFTPSTNPASGNNLWREMKTFSHYAYIVSEVPNSGIQIVDLQYLPDSIHFVKQFIPAGHTSTHSISQSGPYLYLNGCNASFGRGVTILDLSVDPETPVKRGGYNVDYIHDCRVVNDTIYAANINIGKVSIIAATNKDTLIRFKIFDNLFGSGPHNTALTDDRKFLFVTDEIGISPRLMKIWNITDVTNPVYVTNWQPTGITSSIVHNVEIYGNYALVAHYTAGIRLIDISNPAVPVEVAWYDSYPSSNGGTYDGCWGVYMFPSGKIIASDRLTGLYVLRTTFNISMAMQGYYNPSTDQLNKMDTVRAYLRQTSAPYQIVDSSSAVIDSVSFSGSFKFSNASAGTYYIAVKHRNCVETWSRAGGESYNPVSVPNYDFTSSDTKAFGNNMVQVASSHVLYALYSGDVNFDGLVNLADVILTSNDVLLFTTGYVNTDLTGDNVVNLTDLIIDQNNAVKFISKIVP